MPCCRSVGYFAASLSHLGAATLRMCFWHHFHPQNLFSLAQDLSRILNELQRQILEALGIYGKFGLAFLGRLREVYGNDNEFMQEVMAFVDR